MQQSNRRLKQCLASVLAGIVTIITDCAYAADNDAKVQMNVSGTHTPGSATFLCAVGQARCVNLREQAALHLTPGAIKSAFLLNVAGHKVGMYALNLPASCQTIVNSHQTLQIKGKLQTSQNGQPVISHMHCALTG